MTVIQFRPKDYANKPDAVLTEAVGNYETVLIIGWDHDGAHDVRASTGSIGELLHLMESFKHKLLAGDYE